MAPLSASRRLVVKIGSALLVDGATGRLRVDWLRGLCADLAGLKAGGTDVIVVSSGSIALGRGVLNLPAGPLPLEQSQAAAAAGQIKLAGAYEEALDPHGVIAAQILLTLEDSQDRRRYLNTRTTFEQLLLLGAVPIVNENDTIATDEIRFGDNDRLAAQVAVTVGADTLILLSDVDGLYTANPAQDAAAKRLEQVSEITPEIEAMAGDAGTGLSKGGMKTKILAAKTAMRAGCAMAITLGRVERPLSALADGAPATWFLPKDDPQTARKRWIAAMKPAGEVVVDDGAAAALQAGRSLLPIGVIEVRGRFGRGEPLRVLDARAQVLGLGLSRYTSDEARAIRGCQSRDIEAVLGYPGRAALIHRDDLVL